MGKWLSGEAIRELGFEKKILLMCVAGVLLLMLMNFITGQLVNSNHFKMGANEILSPWDTSIAPPVAGPSRVVLKPLASEADRHAQCGGGGGGGGTR